MKQDDLPGEGFCWFWLEIRICEAKETGTEFECIYLIMIIYVTDKIVPYLYIYIYVPKQRDVDNFEISSWNQSVQDTLRIEVVLTSRLLLDIPTQIETKPLVVPI